MNRDRQPAEVVDSQSHRTIYSDPQTQQSYSNRVQQGTAGSDSEVVNLELLARWMDSVFEIPGTGIRFGFDSLIGLIPGLGDAATSLISLAILHTANKRGLSKLTQARMAFNVLLDFAGGAIPVVGDVFDVYWKANQKNVELLRRHVAANPTQERQLHQGDWLFLIGIGIVLFGALIGCLVIAYLIAFWLGSVLFPSLRTTP